MIDPQIQTAIDEAIRLAVQPLQEQIDSLQRELNQFNSASDFDPTKKRTLELLFSGASDKVASSENKAVNEAGASTYNVLNPPDSFIRIGDKNIPAYDS